MHRKTISLRDISKDFHQAGTVLSVLKDINYTFEQGKTYAITGRSGSGKSTLFQLIAGLDSPTKGAVYFDDMNFATISSQVKRRILQEEYGLIFQLPYLIDELTVLENCALKAMIDNYSMQTYNHQAQELLENLGIADKASVLPRTLSGGQQQRVAIARALLNKPSFLVADEPTGNLDENSGNTIIDILLHYNKQYGMGLIISSHDSYVIEKMDTILVLHNGQLSEQKRK